MQKYFTIEEVWTLANSLGYINDNFKTLLTNNAGVTFPIDGLELGMLCFRTDQLKMYTLADVERQAWILTMDLLQTYVTKEYVDTMPIPIERLTNLLDKNTKKIRDDLYNVGVQNGQLVRVGDRNKIDTNLIDTGTSSGKILKVDNENKIPNGVIRTGTSPGTIPIIPSTGTLPNSILDPTIARFSGNYLVFPNGGRIRLGGTE